MLLVICLCLRKGLKAFERSEAEQTRIFGELMEHEKRITRECGIANSESIGDGGSRKGSVGEAENASFFFGTAIDEVGALGQ